jgi:hypothetical protein
VSPAGSWSGTFVTVRVSRDGRLDWERTEEYQDD